MDFGFTREQEAFRKEVGDWLDKEPTLELRQGMEGWAFTSISDAGSVPTERFGQP